MQAVPDHIPILTISRENLQKHMLLFDLLLSRITAQGLRISLLDATSLPDDGDDLQRLITRKILGCDLLITSNLTISSACRLVLGNHVPPYPDGTTFFCREKKMIAPCSGNIVQWLADCIDRTPLYGCILIGGKSSRMGEPKHLIKTADGRTWLERTVNLLSTFTADILLSGRGEIPAHLGHLSRLDDLPTISGPLSGIGAGLQTFPLVSWLVLACDMPNMSEKGILWLLAQRRPGVKAVIPYNPLSDRSEPLGAWYDFRSGPLVEALLEKNELRLRRLCSQDGVYKPVIPETLRDDWRNVNRPGERRISA